jgi:hypothetical protein
MHFAAQPPPVLRVRSPRFGDALSDRCRTDSRHRSVHTPTAIPHTVSTSPQSPRTIQTPKFGSALKSGYLAISSPILLSQDAGPCLSLRSGYMSASPMSTISSTLGSLMLVSRANAHSTRSVAAHAVSPARAAHRRRTAVGPRCLWIATYRKCQAREKPGIWIAAVGYRDPAERPAVVFLSFWHFSPFMAAHGNGAAKAL